MIINKLYKATASLLLATVLLGALSCSSDDDQLPVGASIQPKGPKPAFAPDIHTEMWAVIEKLISYGDPAIPTLSPQQARKNHTVKDAEMDLLAENKVAIPAALVDTIGMMIPVANGSIPARIYTPKNVSGTLPVIVYFHGVDG